MTGHRTTELHSSAIHGGAIHGGATRASAFGQPDEETRHALSGIRALSRAVLDDTKAEAEQIVAQAQGTARALRGDAESEAERISTEILAEAEGEIAHLRQRSLATSRLEAQRLLLTRREELIAAVFARAEERLGELRESPGYKQVLLDLIRDGVDKLGEPPEVAARLSARDAGLLGDADLAQLAERWRGRVRLSLGPALEISGGAVIETADGHKRYDNSFEQRLALLRAGLRAEVYQLLRGAA